MFRSLVAALVLVAVAGQTAIAAGTRYLLIQLENGTVKIEMLTDVAPNHVARIIKLAEAGAYDGIAFHRVMEGFMAQTGDVQYGRVNADGSVSDNAGYGGSDQPDLRAEFSAIPFERGIVASARSTNPHSANSQFFIMFDRNSGLDGKYTVWGRVVEGMELVDNIKLGSRSRNGKVDMPDRMIAVTVTEATVTEE